MQLIISKHLVQKMAWCQTGDKPLSEPMSAQFTVHVCVTWPQWVNTLRQRTNGRHFADNIFKCIFINENVRILLKISLKFVPKVPINNIPALFSWWLGADQATSHYLNQWWLVYWRIYASLGLNELTHWGRVTHICVCKLTTIDSDNGLSPGRRQAIIWTNAGILLIGPLGTNFNEILIGIQTFSFKKMHLKLSSAKWHPLCLGLNVLNATYLHGVPQSL